MSTGTKPTSVTTPQLATPEQPGRGRPSSQPIRRRRRSASHLTRSVRRRVQAASPASSPAAASPHVAARSPEQAPVETETALTPRAPPASASALTPEPPLTLAANHRSRRFLRVKKVETSRTGFAITYVCACQNRVEVRLYDSGYKWVSVEPLSPTSRRISLRSKQLSGPKRRSASSARVFAKPVVSSRATHVSPVAAFSSSSSGRLGFDLYLSIISSTSS